MEANEHIFLIGFSGSGKTTVGTHLARRLDLAFVDTDAIIEKRAGRTIRQIFATAGEREFRRLERDTISELAGDTRVSRVIALGGGAFQSSSNRRTVAASGRTVYLSCSAREIYRRLKHNTDRPLLHSARAGEGPNRRNMQQKIASLLAGRRYNYRKADITVSTTNRSPADAVRIIQQKLRRFDV